MILRFVNYLLPVRTYTKSRSDSRSKITPPVNLTGAVEKGLKLFEVSLVFQLVHFVDVYQMLNNLLLRSYMV